jgi:hypothetical protein
MTPGTAITTESGDALITEAGEGIITETMALAETTTLTGGSRILLPTLADGATLYASSAASNCPVTNLQHRHRTKLWISGTSTTAFVDVDFGASFDADEHAVNCMAFVNFSFTSQATMTVTAGTSQGAADVVSASVFIPWPTVWGFGEGGFGEHGYGGLMTPEEDDAYFPNGNVRIIYFDQTVSARWWRVAIADTATTHISLGRLMLGTYIESTRYVATNPANSPVDPSSVSNTLGGQSWKDSATKYLQASYAFEDTPNDETFELWYWFLSTVGVASPFVGDMVPEANTELLRGLNLRYWEIPPGQPPQITIPRMSEGNLYLNLKESQ